MVSSTGVRLVLGLCLFSAWLPAQQDRIRGPIDGRQTVTIRGSVSLQARTGADQGAVAPDFRLGNITFMLGRSPEQQKALEQLLAEQQDPASPNYHQWLTPESYAARFGASQQDLDRIGDWLRSEGFTVQYTAKGRDFISFSGTARQARTSLHTEIHRYRTGSGMHFANATELALPAAIAPLVAGVMGLDDFHPRAPRRQAQQKNLTATDGSHYLMPDDLATIYDIQPLYNYGYTGSGQNIVIVGQSDIDPEDIAAFRATANLPPMEIQRIPTGNYPGFNIDLIEADLDLEWAGAVARSANLIYVFGDDANYAAYYAIDNNLAPVISESFGLCEYIVAINRMGFLTPQFAAQKANAMGITWLVSSGDSGAAGCDNGVTMSTQGYGVSLPASVPEVTAVGGTTFNEGSGSYWTGNNGISGGSATSYIPETSWNDSALGDGLASTGGGASAIFAKPSWQTGTGVPNDGARDLPDISFSASGAHDPYLVISLGGLFTVGGTSASAPAFAGMVSLLNEFLVKNGVQSKPGLGNINPKLYGMAKTPGVFHDITTGDNIVPCQVTPDCPTGKLGYSAGTGYDLVTGLGSVDTYSLITTWAGLPVVSTSTSVTASPGTILTSGSTVLTATVTAAAGGKTPAGTVGFTLGQTLLGSATLTGSGQSATASITVYGGQLVAPDNVIQVYFAGTPTLTPSSASTVLHLGAPATSSAVTATVNPNPVVQHAPDANGATFNFTVQLKETAGVATTVTGFFIDGVSYTGSIVTFFGTNKLAAKGTITANLRAKNIPVPSTSQLVLTGQDASGAIWSQSVPVTFVAGQ